MQRLFPILVVALSLAGPTGPAWAQAATSTAVAADPLFETLGGRAGIASLIDDLAPRLMGDAQIGSFFARSDPLEFRKQLSDQFCVVAGGPCVYEGATMKKAHAGLGISKAHFNRLVELLQLSMDARGIAFADQNRLLARLAPMHRDVIEAR